MKRVPIIVALAVWLTMSIPADASLMMSGVPTDEGAIPTPANDFHSYLTAPALGLAGLVSGNLMTSNAGTVYFYYHGQESGWNNTFIAKNQDDSVALSYTEFLSSGSTTWNAAGSLLGSITVAAGDVLKLSFDSSGGPEHAIGTTGFGIFAKTVDTGLGSFAITSLFANDGRVYFGHDDGGAGPDDNHDDIIISAFFVAVPEPMSAMVWMGLVGCVCGLEKRRRPAITR